VSAGDLLLEGAGTNLIPHSQQIGLAGFWGINGPSNGVLTLDNATAPDGTFTATTVVASGNGYGPNEFIGGLSASTDYTFSVWLKNNSATEPVRPNIFGNYAQLLNGELTINSVNIIASSIEEFPDGWYRISLTANSGAGGVLFVAIYGNDGADFECWGAQLEESSYPTSYIPTSGSTATRAADVSSSSSNTFGNSFYDQEKVTFYTQWYNNVERTWTDYQAIAGLQNSNGINAISVSTNGGNGYQIYWNAKNNNVSQLNYSAYNIGYPKASIGTFSHAVAATTDDAAFAALGNSVGTDSSITMPTINELVFNAPVHIKRFILWPERLSNDTLQTITV